MATLYFHKHGVNNKIPNSVGVPFPFEKLGDAQGVLALDTEKNASDIADLKEWIKRRSGGISEITKEQFDDLKKNLALPVEKPVSSVRIHTQQGPLDSLVRKAPAQPATAQVVAARVVEPKDVASAGGLEQLVKEQESGTHVRVLDEEALAKKPRVGPAKAKVAESPKANPPPK